MKNCEIQKFIRLCRNWRQYLAEIEILTKKNFRSEQIEKILIEKYNK